MRPFVLASTLILGGCASTGAYVVEPLSEQSAALTYEAGLPILTSAKNASIVSVTPCKVSFAPGNWGCFIVSALNTSADAFNLGVENVSLTHEGKRLHVFTAAELQERARSSAQFSNAASAASAGFESATADRYGKSTSQTQFQGNYLSTSPSSQSIGVVSGRSTTTLYDPSVVAAERARIAEQQRREEEQTAATLQARLQQIDDRLLLTTTVPPGAGHAGEVVADRPLAISPEPVHVEVDLAGEVHSFSFLVSAISR